MIAALVAAVLASAAVLLWPWGANGEAGDERRRMGGRGRLRRGEGRGREKGADGQDDGRPANGLLASLRLRFTSRSSHRRRAAEEVTLLDGLAAALEAGLPTEQALHLALDSVASESGSPLAEPWTELGRAAREGQPLGPAWSRLARRTGSRTAASVARAWSVATSTGAPVAAAVRSTAHAARERDRLERAVDVATAGAHATSTVLALLPLAGVALAALLGIGPRTLYGQPLSVASAGIGLVLLGIGHLTVKRMVGSVLKGVS